MASLAVPIVADSVSDPAIDARGGRRVVVEDQADDVGDEQAGRGNDRGQQRLLQAVAAQPAKELRPRPESDREQEQQEEALLDLARHLDTQLSDGDSREKRARHGAEREAPEPDLAEHVSNPEDEKERELGVLLQHRHQPVSHDAQLRRRRVRAGGFRRTVGHDVATRDRAHGAADVAVDLIVQVRERDADRPVWRVEPAAVQEHDAMVFREPEHDVERMTFAFIHSTTSSPPNLRIQNSKSIRP